MAEIRTLTECNDQLIVALSGNPLETAGALLARGLITSNVQSEMLLPTTGKTKATKLIMAVRNIVQINPNKYHEFVNVLRNEPTNEDIVNILNSTYEKNRKMKVMDKILIEFMIKSTYLENRVSSRPVTCVECVQKVTYSEYQYSPYN